MLTEKYEKDGLLITFQNLSTTAAIAFFGVSDSRNPSEFLGPLMTNLAGMVYDKQVTIDFRSLEYMNSSSVGPILSFVKALDGRTRRTILIYNVGVGWQKTTFECMRVIARSLQRTEVKQDLSVPPPPKSSVPPPKSSVPPSR